MESTVDVEGISSLSSLSQQLFKKTDRSGSQQLTAIGFDRRNYLPTKLAGSPRIDWNEVDQSIVHVHVTTTKPGRMRAWGLDPVSSDRLFMV